MLVFIAHLQSKCPRGSDYLFQLRKKKTQKEYQLSKTTTRRFSLMRDLGDLED
jgi:hypothetical protein